MKKTEIARLMALLLAATVVAGDVLASPTQDEVNHPRKFGEKSRMEVEVEQFELAQYKSNDRVGYVLANKQQNGQQAVLRYHQTIDGIEVVHGKMVFEEHAGVRKTYDYTGKMPKALKSAPEYKADRMASKKLSGAIAEDAVFVFFKKSDGQIAPAWRSVVNMPAAGTISCEHYLGSLQYTDAETGSVLYKEPVAKPIYREVWQYTTSTRLPSPCTAPSGGTLALKAYEGGPTGSGQVLAAFTNSGFTVANYFGPVLGSNFLQLAGDKVKSQVYVGTKMNNAFWDSATKTAHFGDGDGSRYSSLANSKDVVTHEFTHGLVEETSDLVYQGEPGAINESLSDVLGAHSEYRANGNTLNANVWKIAEASFTPGISGDALRYLNNPTQDGVSKDHYSSRHTDPGYDFGGVHLNSGIGNLAFYLMSQGGNHPRLGGASVIGIGIDAAAKLFYAANEVAGPYTDFAGFKLLMVNKAKTQYGAGSNQHLSVCQAWNAVGVANLAGTDCGAVPAPAPGAPTNFTIQSGSCYGHNWATVTASAGATRYEVWTSTSSSNFTNAILRASSTGTSWIDFEVPSLSYVKVKACNATGCSPLSSLTRTATYLNGCM